MNKTPEIRMVRLEDLVDDPLNAEAFNEGSLDKLTADVKEKGFFGDVAAWPDGKGKYVLESGHRRRKAAQMAGLAEIPVFVTDPPADDVERRKRLTQWNLNGRDWTPVDVAKLVAFTYGTMEMEKEKGRVKGPLLDLTAKELGISTSSVTKYKALLSLRPALLEIAAEGNCQWAVLATASSLTASAQDALAGKIRRAEKLGGYDASALRRDVEEFKAVRLFSDAAATRERLYGKAPEPGPSGRRRRLDGAKRVLKAEELISSALGKGASIKEGEMEAVMDSLERIREIIEVWTRLNGTKD